MPERFLPHAEVEMEPDAEQPTERWAEFEIGLREDFEAIARTITNFEEISAKARTPEQKTKIDLLREKIARACGKFIKTGRSLTLIALTALAVNHSVTHPDLEVTMNESGHLGYRHPDAETTHILNFFAGREEISAREALNHLRNKLTTKAEMLGIKLPDGFDTYDIDQLTTFVFGIYSEGTPDTKLTELAKIFFKFHYIERMELPADASQQIYDLVWELERECGNPKIRFADRQLSSFWYAQFDEDVRGASYDPLTNTVYLAMDKSEDPRANTDLLLAELSHAKQFKEEPWGAYMKGAIASLRIFASGGFDPRTLYEAQKREYTTLGSVEHEAHSVIQPKLEKQYESLGRITEIKKYRPE